MEFLTKGRQRIPHDMDAGKRAEIIAAEGARAQELIDQGTLKRIWRVPGQRGSWTLWESPDATTLHAALESLPLYPWYDLEVFPLAQHARDPA
jgi:muconolactone D-isomerase